MAEPGEQPSDYRSAELVALELGVRPPERRNRVLRLEQAGATHWLLRRLASSGRAYATPAEADELRHLLESAEFPLEPRRNIGNALVTKRVELRAEWMTGRPPHMDVTVDAIAFARVVYRPYQPGWAIEFASAAEGPRGPIPIESLADYLPDELEADQTLLGHALTVVLHIAASRLARRPLHPHHAG